MHLKKPFAALEMETILLRIEVPYNNSSQSKVSTQVQLGIQEVLIIWQHPTQTISNRMGKRQLPLVQTMDFLVSKQLR